MQSRRIEGLWLPLITPFRDGALDERSLRRLARHYLGQPVDGMILAATTGEGLTIDEDETERLTAIVAIEVAGRIPVFLGLSGSDTRKVAKALAHTAPWPVDGYLIACPYYTRPSQAGLYHHFAALAGETARPIMIYNIPYRTGVNLANDTLLRLAELPNIVGVKDCCADQVQSFDLMRARPDGFAVMTGEDALLYAALTQGGDRRNSGLRACRDGALRGDPADAARRRPSRGIAGLARPCRSGAAAVRGTEPGPDQALARPRRADRQSRSPRSDDAGQRGACGADRAGNGRARGTGGMNFRR
jgi:4-hydroxy-tetrahydrodipicolinate synthase